MHLSPRDIDKLLLHGVGFLAQKRLARGLRLNYPEAVALISTQLLEFIRDGHLSVAELMDVGCKLLGRAQVMEGVPEMVEEVQVEGTFPDGTKLVSVHQPIQREHGDLSLALYGSFLPVMSPGPQPESSTPTAGVQGLKPGEVLPHPSPVVINQNRDVITLEVTNRGDRPIQVGSHYHFVEVNRDLVFDRARAYGRRLDILAGTAIRFEKDQTRSVELVPIAGEQVIQGGNGLASGKVSPENQQKAMEQVLQRGFGHKEQV
jgi:urease subunit gamma/beta